MFDSEVLSAEVTVMFWGLSGGPHFERLIEQAWLKQLRAKTQWTAFSRWFAKTPKGRASARIRTARRNARLKALVLELRWCNHCKKEFEVTGYDATFRGKSRYCGKACAASVARDTRAARNIREIHGVKRTVQEWAALHGLTTVIIRARMSRGWDFERAVSEPLDTRRVRKSSAMAAE